MNLERITDQAHPHYAPAWTLYQAAFPANERRDEAWQAQALAQVEYHMCAAQEDGGLIAWARNRRGGAPGDPGAAGEADFGDRKTS